MAITLGTAKPFIDQAKFGQEQAVTQLQSQIQQASQGPQSTGQAPGPEQMQKLSAEMVKAQAAPSIEAQAGAAKQAQTEQAQQLQNAKMLRTRKIIEQRQQNQVKQRESEQKLSNIN
jgi:hypothetical protein